MTDPRFRARVLRLLSSDFRVDDLKTLFLYARDRCDGSEAVREVGDFVAHHDERNKGIITKSVRDWFTVVRFIAPRFLPEIRPFDEYSLPIDTPAYLSAAFRRKDAASFRSEMGFSLTAGRSVLKGLLKRFEENPNGTLRLTRFIMPKERDLLNNLLGGLHVSNAFTADNLFLDFRSTLIRNKILDKKEASAFESIRAPIGLFAIAAMHNNNIIMDDKSVIKLSAQPSHYDGMIQVFASVPTGITTPRPINISAPIFGDKINLLDHLALELSRTQNWHDEIELRDDKRLHAIPFSH